MNIFHSPYSNLNNKSNNSLCDIFNYLLIVNYEFSGKNLYNDNISPSTELVIFYSFIILYEPIYASIINY